MGSYCAGGGSFPIVTNRARDVQSVGGEGARRLRRFPINGLLTTGKVNNFSPIKAEERLKNRLNMPAKLGVCFFGMFIGALVWG